MNDLKSFLVMPNCSNEVIKASQCFTRQDLFKEVKTHTLTPSCMDVRLYD